jgi:D-psicose/D-tagatose/L-ribulose 3-epimerase
MVDCATAARAEEEPIPALLRRWLPTGLIAHVHLNDPNRLGPGQGGLSFAPILRALAEFGYRGTAAVEPFVYEPDGAACAARAIGYLRGTLEAMAAFDSAPAV